MQFSIDDLVMLNAAVIRSEPGSTEPPRPDPIAMKQMATCLEHAGFLLDDPIALAAYLAAYISWVRPFGPTSDRTALLTAAVVLDLSKAKTPMDWAGCAALLAGFRESHAGPGARSTALSDWLRGRNPSAQP